MKLCQNRGPKLFKNNCDYLRLDLDLLPSFVTRNKMREYYVIYIAVKISK